jgi:L-lactate dehydrogenase complex protein LldG
MSESNEARETVLGRIRTALGEALLPESAPDHPANDLPRDTAGPDRFVKEVEALSGQVIRVATADEAAQAAASLCAERGLERAFTWAWDEVDCPGLSEALAGAGVDAVQGGDPRELEPVPVGITGAEAALADTGTLVLRAGPGRSPLASLLPPVHVALLDAARVAPDMPTYLAGLGDAAAHVREVGMLNFISGPSRTADIEQTTTLGVHGPRELIIIMWGA